MRIFKFIIVIGLLMVIMFAAFILKDLWILDDKYDLTQENYPWWHEKINFSRNIRAEDIEQNVVVAIVDTGVDKEDFPYPNIVQGYNAVNGSVDTSDKHGHGKVLAHHVASPKIGVNPYATILPIKVRNSMIDKPETVSKGIVWAVDHGADIINLSLGRAPAENNVQLGYREGVEYALKKGKLIIASAGTSGKEVFYPGAIEGVFSVGGLDENFNYTSNIDVKEIDIFAVDPKNPVSSSFPTAIVSGAASLITALDETISSKEAMNIILEQADVININGQSAKLLNVDRAIDYSHRAD